MFTYIYFEFKITAGIELQLSNMIHARNLIYAITETQYLKILLYKLIFGAPKVSCIKLFYRTN